jgi:hypothetical protein
MLNSIGNVRPVMASKLVEDIKNSTMLLESVRIREELKS